jgi:hypothetical protein
MFASTKIQWPTIAINFFNFFSIFNLNLDITAPECAFRVEYAYKWSLIECGPLIIAGIFFVVHLTLLSYRGLKKRRGRDRTRRFRVAWFIDVDLMPLGHS